MAILVDVSGNLSPEDVQLEIDFVFDLVMNGLSLDSGSSRLAFLTYSDIANVHFYLSNLTNRAMILNAISVYHASVNIISLV